MKSIVLIVLLLNTVLLFGQSADEYFKSALKESASKNNKAALKWIDKAIVADPNNYKYYGFKGLVLFELGEFQKAYDSFSMGIIVNPKAADIYLNRGNLFLGTGQYEDAIADFTQSSIVADNDSAKYSAIMNRASAKLSIREFEGAYEDLMKCYAFDSTDVGTLTNLGAVCDEIGRGDETLKYLLKAVEVDPEFYAAYGNIAFKYQEMGEYQKAIEYCDIVLKFSPDDPYGLSNRSYNKLMLGDVKGAMKDIEKSIKLYPVNSFAYKNRALIHLKNGDTEKACADLLTAIEKGFTEAYGQEVNELIEKHCKH